VGENAFLEFMEIAGAAATGIGLAFVGIKVARYALLIKRIFIDQEPLLKMQNSIEMGMIHSLQESEENLYRQLTSYADQLLIDAELKLKTIHAQSLQKLDWAVACLRSSSLISMPEK
jgi:hypothetical protein